MLNSPCDGNCKLDFNTKICMGCFRTMDEILNWINFTEDQKEKVNNLVKHRKMKLKDESKKD
ncbi:MAG: DUF1289 domain-containing protein [Bacteroidetes bacterium]|nr:DUF1289 domain-containing protein [Bacteroidota bacterium]